MSQEYGTSPYTATIPALSDDADINAGFKAYHDDISTFLAAKANLSGAVFTGAITFGTGGSITLPDGSITSAKIANGAIVNEDINSGAAITYGKLALTGSIVDNDISSSANIAQSKILNLVSNLAAKAPLASPDLTGTATAVNLTISGTTKVGLGAGVIKSGSDGTLSLATAGTDYLVPSGSANISTSGTITATGSVVANGGILGASAKNMTVVSGYSGSTFAAIPSRVIISASTSSATSPTTRPDGTTLVAGDIWISW